MSLEEHLRFEAVQEPIRSKLSSSSSLLKYPTRATPSGLNWLAAPSSFAGLAFRVGPSEDNNNALMLEALSITDDSDGDADNNNQIQSSLGSVNMPDNVHVVQMATTPHGRLVAVCLSDGSLRCYDVTANSFELRWTIGDVHSHNDHCHDDDDDDDGSRIRRQRRRSRVDAAGGAGPIRSLQFSNKLKGSEGDAVILAMVDHGDLYLIEANSTQRNVTPMKQSLGNDVVVSCCAWAPWNDDNHKEEILAVGTTTGSVLFYLYDPKSLSMIAIIADNTGLTTQIPCPRNDDYDDNNSDNETSSGWVCTHLDWCEQSTIAVGYCRVTAEEEEEGEENDYYDEDEEEFDDAEHEAAMYMMDIDPDKFVVRQMDDMNDVVPFFSVPKHGRHVYFTATVKTAKVGLLLLVASNVGSDVAVLCRGVDDDDDDDAWIQVDASEGNAATTPLTVEDEFTYPTGLAVVRATHDSKSTKSTPILLLAATDGSLSALRLVHDHDHDFFRVNTQPEELRLLYKEPVSPRRRSSTASSLSSRQQSTSTQPEELKQLYKEPVSPPRRSSTASSLSSRQQSVSAAITAEAKTTDSTQPFGLGTTPAFGGPATTFSSSFGSASVTSPSLGGSTSIPTTTSDKPTLMKTGSYPADSSEPKLFSFGTTPAFGSATPFGAPFGSGSTTGGLSFGTKLTTSNTTAGDSTNETKQPFGQGSAPVFGSAAPTFGAPLGSSGIPTFGSGSRPSFSGFGTGSNSGSSIFAPKAAASSSAWTSTSSPFNAFESKVTPVNPLAAMAKPLFGPSATTNTTPTKSLSLPASNTPVGSTTKTGVEGDIGAVAAAIPERKIKKSDYYDDDDSSGARAARAFDMYDDERSGLLPTSYLRNLLEELDYGGEMDGQLAKLDEERTGMIRRDAFIDWFENLVVDAKRGQDDDASNDEEGSLSWEDRAEREAEWEKARKHFQKLSVDDEDAITTSDLSKLLETLGTVTDKGEHRKIINRLENPKGKIKWETFSKWYIPWAFSDDEDSHEEDDKGGEEKHERDTTSAVAEKPSTPGSIGAGVHLIEGSGNDDDDPDYDEGSLDSEEKAEREAEREKARKHFHSLAAKDGGGADTISTSDFPNLLTNLGTVYCEEEHKRNISRLEKPKGMIQWKTFSEWYIRWLFSDDVDSSNEEEDEEEEEEEQPKEKKVTEQSGWGKLFSVAKDSWKCESCMVRNEASAKKCSACETARPGEEGTSVAVAEKPSALGSIGAGGFSFGGSGTVSDTKGGQSTGAGFSFGSSSAFGVGASSGFSFRSLSPPAKVDSQPGGFQFGSVSSSGGGSGGFTFGAAKKPDSDDNAVGSSVAASGGYPPMSLKAPTLDSQQGKIATTKQTTTAFPPMASKAPMSTNAPTPVNQQGKVTSTKQTTSKAPTPFSSSTSIPSSGAYPPMSMKAPTPVSQQGKVTSTKQTTTSFPPMASKAPTPFSSSASISTSGDPSSGAYPPMSMKAPTPVSQQGKVATKSGTSASGGYPPMSLKAPTPVSEQGKAPATKQTTTAFPPMASEAPTPFSSSTSISRPGGASSGTYPPMSMKAPTPVSQQGKAATKSGTSASGGYPPMSLKAPTPVSQQGKAQTTKQTTTAFPPMASEAPTPFSSALISSPGGPSSGAYPPMSMKAPTPVSQQGKAATTKQTTTAFPPMASKAPTPFSSSTSIPSSGAYPPMSTKAPTPVNQQGKVATTKQSTSKAPTPFSSSTSIPSSGAYPPMASKAPTPFFSTGAHTSTTTPIFSSASGAYLPMSMKGPTPVSHQGKAPTTKQPSAAFPHMASKAPTPFSSSHGTSTSISSSAGSAPSGYSPMSMKAPTAVNQQTSKSTKPFPSKSSSSSTNATLSESSLHFARLTAKMSNTLVRLHKNGTAASDKSIKHDIQQLVQGTDDVRASLSSIDSALLQSTRRSSDVASSRPVAQRQVAESQRMVEHLLNPSNDHVFMEQPLDRASEECRRHLASKAMETDRTIGIACSRLELLEQLEGPEYREAILNATLQMFYNVKEFERESCRVAGKLHDLRKAVNGKSRLPGKTSTALVVPGSSDWKTKGEDTARKWNNINASFKALPSARVKSFDLKTGTRQQSPPNELRVTRKGGKRVQSLTDERPLFSPPPSVKPRAGWDERSVVDQTRIKEYSFTAPDELREMTLRSASHEALAKYGTTPEKVKEAQSIRAKGSVDKSLSFGTTIVSSARNAKTESAAVSSPAAFPAVQATAPTPASSKDGALVTIPKQDDTPPFSQSKIESRRPGFGAMSELGDALSSPNAKSATTSSKQSKASDEEDHATRNNDRDSSCARPDYRSLLYEILKKYNPRKADSVDRYLEMYKGREQEVFLKLSSKFNIPNPLDSQPGSTGIVQASEKRVAAPASKEHERKDQSSVPSRGATFPPKTVSVSQLSLSGMSDLGSVGAPAPSPFVVQSPPPAANASPFASSGQKTTQPSFLGGNETITAPSYPTTSMESSAPQTTSQSPFGAPAIGSVPSPFGMQGSSAMPAQSPFGTNSNNNNNSTLSSTPFGGVATTTPMTSTASSTPFGGGNPREMLVSFYQQNNPAKLPEIDRLLEKYKNREEQMFRNLAKKYNLDPSIFGLSPASNPQPPQTNGSIGSGFGSGGFGAPSVLGGGPSPFGAPAPTPSPFSAPSSTGGGGSSGGGFGQTSALGGGGVFGTTSGSPAAPTSGGSVFGSAAVGTGGGGFTNFGSLAQQQQPQQQQQQQQQPPMGFGAFGSPATSGPSPFGTTTPFGAPRR